MQILLFIFKIIFSIVLVLLVFLLLALAVLLLVPIRYEVKGEIQEGLPPEISGNVRYLFSLFKRTFTYHDGVWEVKRYRFGRRRKKILEEPDISEPEEALWSGEKAVQEKAEKEKSMQKGFLWGLEKAEKEVVLEKPAAQEMTEREEKKEVLEKEAKRKETGRTEKKYKRTAKKEKRLKNPLKMLQNIEFARIKQELFDTHNRSAVRKILREVRYLFSHFKFRKLWMNLQFGTGNPAATGQVLGILSLIPVLYQYEVCIVPDFETEEAYLKGSFCIGGRVRLIHALAVGIRLLTDKEIRLAVKKLLPK